MNERTIFLQALEKRSEAERVAYLTGACAGDTALRERVEELLRAHAEAGSFLDTPALAQAASGQATPGDPTQTHTEGSHAGDDEIVLDFLTPSQQADSLGRLDHYEVLATVGRGGMGMVLRVFDKKLHRVVALKVMTRDVAGSVPARKRFSREAKAAAAVVHDHIVPIHAIEEAGPTPYLVMQLIDGQSLQEKIALEGSLELKEVLRIGMQIALGLAAAHKQGLVHRDIKPSNILLENGVQRVKITDFGLARAVDDASVSQSGLVAGTPQYMSPEQADGQPLDHRSDLFSLGSVLYAMCTGRPPFRAASTVATLKRVCEETPRPIRELNPDMPAWLCDIIARLHAKKPADRFQSAVEVAELLERHLAHLQQPNLVPQPVLPAAKPSRPLRPAWAVPLVVWSGFLLLSALAVYLAERLRDYGENWLGLAGLTLGLLVVLVFMLVGVLARPEKKESVVPPRRNRRWWIGGAVGVVAVVGVALTLLEGSRVTHLIRPFFQTEPPDGNLMVEIGDPELTPELILRVNGKTGVMVGPTTYSFAVDPGTSRLEVFHQDQLIYSESIEIPRHSSIVTRVFPRPEVPDAATAGRDAALTERDRLQGDWQGMLVAYIGGPELGPEALPLTWLRVEGSRLRLRLPGFDMSFDFKTTVTGSTRKLLLNGTGSTSTFSIKRPVIAYEFIDRALYLRIDEPQPSVLQDHYREEGLPLPTPPNQGLTIVFQPKEKEIQQGTGQVGKLIPHPTADSNGSVVAGQPNRPNQLHGLGRPTKDSNRSEVEGRWVLVSAQYQGRAVSPEGLKDIYPSELIFKGNQYGILWAGKKHEGALHVESTKHPAEIDFSGSVFEGLKPRMAIYELAPDQLKLCLPFVGPKADPPRPANFKTGPKSKNVVLIYRREPER